MKQLLQLWAGVGVIAFAPIVFGAIMSGRDSAKAVAVYSLLYAGFLVGSLTTKLMK